METNKNELIKSMSLVIIDDIEEVLNDIEFCEIPTHEGVAELKLLLKRLKNGLGKIY